MSASQEGKKLISMIKTLWGVVREYDQLPSKTAEGRDSLKYVIDELTVQHTNLCCNVCGQYNDRCTCK